MSLPHPLLSHLPQGYVVRRGRCVEHFSFCDPEKGLIAARDLATHCERLEAKGFPVNARTCRSRDLYQQAPAQSPWITAMTSYYAIFADASGRAPRCVLRLHDNSAVAVRIVHGQLTLECGYETEQTYGTVNLFDKLQEEGFSPYRTEEVINYDQLITLFADVGLTPNLVDAVLVTPIPPQPDAEPVPAPT